MAKHSCSVGLDEELYEDLKKVSVAEGRTPTQTIRRAVRLYVQEHLPEQETHGVPER